MHFAKFFKRFVVCVQNEMFTTQISFKMLHSPNSSLHFEKKRSIIGFVFLQLSAGVRDDVVRASRIRLRENGAETTGVEVVTESSVGKKSIPAVAPRIADNGFRTENRLKFSESSHGRTRKLVVDPGGVFTRESSERCRNLSKILDMSAKEIA